MGDALGRLRSRPLAAAVAAAAAVAVLATAALGVRELIRDDARASGPAPKTYKKLMWGPVTMPDGRSAFPTMRDLGVGIFAIQARWETIAPTEPRNPRDWRDPAYEWPKYLDDMLAEARRYKMKIQLMLMGAPRWANGGRPWNWMPHDPGDYGDFAAAISRRYPEVELWMIWGEPNRQPNFRPLAPAPEATAPEDPLTPEQQVAPRNYAMLLESAYEALKAADPQDLVIGGNTYTSAGADNIRPWQWIRYMTLPDGSRPRMDMWGHNPWGNRRPDLKLGPSNNGTVSFPDLPRLAAALDRAGFAEEPLRLYLSEWGVPTGFEDVYLGQEVSPKTADKWVRSAFRITREWGRIYTLGWVHLFDKEGISTGLLTQDAKRKSTYRTFKRSG